MVWTLARGQQVWKAAVARGDAPARAKLETCGLAAGDNALDVAQGVLDRRGPAGRTEVHGAVW